MSRWLHSTWCWETQTTGQSIAVDVDEVDTLSIKCNHHDGICTKVKNLPQIKRKWLLHLCSVRNIQGLIRSSSTFFLKLSTFCSSAPLKYVGNYKIWYLLHMFTIRKSFITYADTSRWITCASYRPIYKLNTDIRYNGPILGAHGTQTLFILYSEEKRPAILSDSKSK